MKMNNTYTERFRWSPLLDCSLTVAGGGWPLFLPDHNLLRAINFCWLEMENQTEGCL